MRRADWIARIGVDGAAWRARYIFWRLAILMWVVLYFVALVLIFGISPHLDGVGVVVVYLLCGVVPMLSIVVLQVLSRRKLLREIYNHTQVPVRGFPDGVLVTIDRFDRWVARGGV